MILSQLPNLDKPELQRLLSKITQIKQIFCKIFSILRLRSAQACVIFDIFLALCTRLLNHLSIIRFHRAIRWGVGERGANDVDPRFF